MANDDNVRDIYIERDNWFRSQIAAGVEEGAAAGTIRGGVDAEAFAYLLVAMLRGSVLQLMLSPDAAMVNRHLT